MTAGERPVTRPILLLRQNYARVTISDPSRYWTGHKPGRKGSAFLTTVARKAILRLSEEGEDHHDKVI